ncbi:phenylacetate--CoA ligase family protein [Inmirania thermothiophila]|uniref:Phenylacetate-CoA ligase n=1 Tax=Inmirania thermothiophila TaxID=1750597 RepID=A0A3N1XXI5_9GAMM|nr:AMP-binding protein [Inmirania thermothiophila]ROR29637.1 phenylacetate-CoA ligase [Inmirania thermothiophila]
MSPYTRLVSGLLFPLHERLKGHDTVRALRELEASQWWPPERLEALRLARLRRLLARAGAQVPYYRRLFAEHGFDPAAVASLGDLAALPFLTKADIRAHAEALRAEDARGLARFNTGGSTGEPLVFWIGRERVTRDVAAKWRATRWWGVDIGDREIVVWGSPVEIGAQDRLRAVRDRILRTRLLPAFEMSPGRIRDYLAVIRRSRPRMLFGYPSSLDLLARAAEREGLRLDGLGIRVAFVTAERLYDEQRSRIARVFGCRVANGYGGRDAGFLAHECPEGRMHITAEDVVLELVDAAGRPVPPGEPGEVVVTHLATGDFPFIRYRTGDVAVLDDAPCPCGRGLPVLREVMGRTTDFVVARDGTVMHGLALIYVVRDLPGIERFRIEQESLERTRVLLVPGPGFEAGHVERIRAGFRQRLGEGVEIDVETVERIPPLPSGKHRYVISRVDPYAQAAA